MVRFSGVVVAVEAAGERHSYQDGVPTVRWHGRRRRRSPRETSTTVVDDSMGCATQHSWELSDGQFEVVVYTQDFPATRGGDGRTSLRLHDVGPRVIKTLPAAEDDSTWAATPSFREVARAWHSSVASSTRHALGRDGCQRVEAPGPTEMTVVCGSFDQTEAWPLCSPFLSMVASS